MSLSLEPILCPSCKLKAAFQRCFGKRAYCFNCEYDWSLKWKGNTSFSSKMRSENV